MKSALITVERKRDAKHPLAQKIDDNTFFRYFYLPYIIMDLFNDYVETVTLQAAQMRIPELKGVCRKIKQLRKDYEYLTHKHLGYNNQKKEKAHMELFIEIFDNNLDSQFQLIKWLVSKNQKMLDDNWRNFIASVYMAMIVYIALKSYANEADARIEELWGGDTHHSIVPDMIDFEYKELYKCLLDYKALNNDDIYHISQQILSLIKRVTFEGEFKDMDRPKPTLYQRYLEEKGDKKKAPDGLARKLMKEFGIATLKEYYKQLNREKNDRG